MSINLHKKISLLCFTSLFIGCLSLRDGKAYTLENINFNKFQLPQKEWNLVHILKKRSDESLKIANYLISRKALLTPRAAETVILSEDFFDKEGALAVGGFNVYRARNEDFPVTEDKPYLLIVDDKNKKKYVREYYSSSCAKNCKIDDLMQLMRLRIK
ncbi:MAG: hypothetical protein ACXVAX_08590 [Pseudobdellovibrio sp.]